MGISEQRRWRVRAGSTNLVCRRPALLQPSALMQPPKVTLDKSRRLHLHGRQSRLTHANTQPIHEAGLQPSSGSGGQPGSEELLWDMAGNK